MNNCHVSNQIAEHCNQPEPEELCFNDFYNNLDVISEFLAKKVIDDGETLKWFYGNAIELNCVEYILSNDSRLMKELISKIGSGEEEVFLHQLLIITACKEITNKILFLEELPIGYSWSDFEFLL